MAADKSGKSAQEREKEQRSPAQAALPGHLEMVHGLSKLAVTLVGLAVAMLSVRAGADVLAIVARTGSAILALGLLLWLLNGLLYRGALEAAQQRVEESDRSAGNSVEWEA
jgi:hypothetical protein